MKRLHEWEYFSSLVRKHIEEYTIPQYGDAPNDLVANWSAEKCTDEILKYAWRFSQGQRGEKETLRDLLKIAHYAALAYCKMEGEE